MLRLIGKIYLIFSVWFLVSIHVSNVPTVLALEPTAKIYPSKGTVFTDIFLQVRGLDKYVEGEFAPAAVGLELYVFWDDKLIIERQGDIMSGSYHLHIFDAHFSPPNEYPYSKLGNHTIVAEVWKSSQFLINFTLTFEIIEYVPCPEYISLNASYHALLGNYSELLDSSETLETQFNYLNSSYYEIKGSYASLNFTYNALRDMYSQLQLDYNDLESKHDTLTNDLGVARNLSYLFIITTLAFLATTIYLGMRKTKLKT